MGQASIDLPDPLEPPDMTDDADATSAAVVAAPAPLAGADDLLAQLAGEEIDRLLAEADAEMPPARPAPPAPAVPHESIVPAATSVVAPAIPSPDQPADGANLGDVLDHAARLAATPTDLPATAEPAPAPNAADRELESHVVGQNEQTYTIADLNTSADESAALLGDPRDAELPPPATKVEADSEDAPLLVRTLELLNAPASSLSDGARDAIGKIAILTLFNSIAVLLYVLIFRTKH